jgi:hypothetical protein
VLARVVGLLREIGRQKEILHYIKLVYIFFKLLDRQETIDIIPRLICFLNNIFYVIIVIAIVLEYK